MCPLRDMRVQLSPRTLAALDTSQVRQVVTKVQSPGGWQLARALERSPSPAYGAALLMQLGIASLASSNLARSALER